MSIYAKKTPESQVQHSLIHSAQIPDIDTCPPLNAGENSKASQFEKIANNSSKSQKISQLQSMANNLTRSKFNSTSIEAMQNKSSIEINPIPSHNIPAPSKYMDHQSQINTTTDVVQRVYGPTDATIENDKISDVTIQRPGTRPNVPFSVSSQGGIGTVYRHHTNWSLIRDSMGQKYVGMDIEEAMKKIAASLKIPEHLTPEATKEKFIEYLKKEFNEESQFGAMGDSATNDTRNHDEISKSALTKNSPTDHDKFHDWVQASLDVGFKRNTIANPQEKLQFDLQALSSHIGHTARAMRFRANKGSVAEKNANTALSSHQSLSDILQGTLKNFENIRFRKRIIECYLESKGITASTKIKDLELDKLDDALNDYKNHHELLMQKFYYSDNNGEYEETQHGGYNLESLADYEEDAEDKYRNQQELMQDEY